MRISRGVENFIYTNLRFWMENWKEKVEILAEVYCTVRISRGVENFLYTNLRFWGGKSEGKSGNPNGSLLYILTVQNVKKTVRKP